MNFVETEGKYGSLFLKLISPHIVQMVRINFYCVIQFGKHDFL